MSISQNANRVFRIHSILHCYHSQPATDGRNKTDRYLLHFKHTIWCQEETWFTILISLASSIHPHFSVLPYTPTSSHSLLSHASLSPIYSLSSNHYLLYFPPNYSFFLPLTLYDLSPPHFIAFHLLHPYFFLLSYSPPYSFLLLLFLSSLFLFIFLLALLLSFYPDPRSISYPTPPLYSLLIY